MDLLHFLTRFQASTLFIQRDRVCIAFNRFQHISNWIEVVKRSNAAHFYFFFLLPKLFWACWKVLGVIESRSCGKCRKRVEKRWWKRIKVYGYFHLVYSIFYEEVYFQYPTFVLIILICNTDSQYRWRKNRKLIWVKTWKVIINSVLTMAFNHI